jgi:beta-lactamase class C
MGTSATKSSPDSIRIIRQSVEQYLETTHAPGVCVSVIDFNIPELKDGYIHPAGVQKLLDGPPVTRDTIFQIGSVTKLFTSLLTAYAVVEQKVQLKDKAIGFLSGYSNVTGSDDFNNIELVDLATHTSGMPGIVQNINHGSQQLFADEAPAGTMVTYWNQYSGATTLPACWLYSDVGFVTLGFAVAAMFNPATPQTNNYGQLLQSLVTGPLGMNLTGAHPQGNYATGYNYRNGSNYQAPGIAFDLKSTGHNMLRFLKVSLNDSAISVPPNLAQAIALTQTFRGDFPICGSSSKHMRMGLGWQMPEVPEGGSQLPIYYKNGATSLGGQSCVVELVPENGFGIAVLTSQYPNDEKKATPPTLATAIRTQLIGGSAWETEIEETDAEE